MMLFGVLKTAIAASTLSASLSTVSPQQSSNAIKPAPDQLRSFLRRVDQNFPKLVSVRLESEIARAKNQEKRGAFDPVFSFNTDSLRYNPSSAPGKVYETFMTETAIDVLDRSGAKLSIGARLNTGNVKSPANSTGYLGEYFVSAKIPLIRDRLVNAKTIAEQQSIIGIPLADQFIRETELGVILKAGEAYWEWVGAGEKLAINRTLYQVAVDRAEFIRKRVEAGSNPPIDNAEASAEVFRRQGSLEKAERDLQKAEFKLQIYLWNSEVKGDTVPIPRSELPPLRREINPLTDTWVEAGRSQAIKERPELLAIRLSRDIVSLDLRQALNERRPALDLGIGPGADLGGGGIGLTYKAGIFYSIPLRQNTADGRIAVSRLKINKLDLEEIQTTQTINIEVSDAVSAIRQAILRVQAADQEVKAAIELERGERIRFENGLSTLFLINQRERARAEAEIRAVDVRVEYEQALLSFYVTTTQLEPLFGTGPATETASNINSTSNSNSQK